MAGEGKATVPCVNVNTRIAVFASLSFSSQLLVLKREKEHKFTIYLFILVSHEDCDSDTANVCFSLYKVNSPSGLGRWETGLISTLKVSMETSPFFSNALFL